MSEEFRLQSKHKNHMKGCTYLGSSKLLLGYIFSIWPALLSLNARAGGFGLLASTVTIPAGNAILSDPKMRISVLNSSVPWNLADMDS